MPAGGIRAPFGTCSIVEHSSVFKSSYLGNHSSESIHIWNMKPWRSYSMKPGRPQGPCLRVGLEVKSRTHLKSDFSAFLFYIQFMEIVGQTSVIIMKWTFLFLSEGQYDLFHGPVFLPHILTIWWMTIKLLDNESVWHKLWPQNKYKSQWLIFHSLMILPCILKTDGWTLCDPTTEQNLYFTVQWGVWT